MEREGGVKRRGSRPRVTWPVQVPAEWFMRHRRTPSIVASFILRVTHRHGEMSMTGTAFQIDKSGSSGGQI